jgi:hypothetical protein
MIRKLGSVFPGTKAKRLPGNHARTGREADLSEMGIGLHSNQAYADGVDLSAVDNPSKQQRGLKI